MMPSEACSLPARDPGPEPPLWALRMSPHRLLVTAGEHSWVFMGPGAEVALCVGIRVHVKLRGQRHLGGGHWGWHWDWGSGWGWGWVWGWG